MLRQWDSLSPSGNDSFSMLLHQFLDLSASRHPDKCALICEGQRHTYREVADRTRALAQLMRERGIRRGDRVALFMDNSAEMVAAIFAVLRIGAVFMPVNPMTKRDKLAYMLNDARAAALIAHVDLSGVWEPALQECATVHTVVLAGQVEECRAVPAYAVGYPSSSATAQAEPASETIDQDLAAIIYTSGSTGDPKGVMLTHLNMVSAANSVSSYLELDATDVIVCVLPLSFDYGLYQVLMSAKMGATLVLEASFAFPRKVLESMAREKVTVFPGVPTIFTTLIHMQGLDGFDLRSLRTITNTAAALSEEHIRRVRSLFPTARLFSMYGLTECKRVTYLPPEQLDIRPTSVGRGMPNEEVWLVDEEGRRLPNGHTGELVIRGSNVMRGYWEKPKETAERLRPGSLPGEMVLYSGDLFRTDDEGWLYFVARKDDIIKSRGEKVSPREVENAIYGLDGVLEAAVIGVDDELLGQAIKAFVVLKEGFTYSEREVIRHCLGHLENFMAPKFVEFVDDLPVTNTGKIRKSGLR